MSSAVGRSFATRAAAAFTAPTAHDQDHEAHHHEQAAEIQIQPARRCRSHIPSFVSSR
jgi:hypothetical protein